MSAVQRSRLAQLVKLKNSLKDSTSSRPDQTGRHDQSGRPDQRSGSAGTRDQDHLATTTTTIESRHSERERNLEYTLEQHELYNSKQQQKQDRLDRGFSDYQQAAHKQYLRLVQTLPQSTTSSTTTPYTSALATQTNTRQQDKLSQHVVTQQLARKTFSRRRAHKPDDHVDYINERNLHFNKKIKRHYDEYTKEIRDNFERGTAL